MNYIIESKPNIINIDNSLIENIEEKLKNNETISNEEINYLLSYICYSVRTKLSNDIENDSFSFKCDTAQAIISYYLNNLNITNYPCMTQRVITNNIVGHSFIVCNINDTLYLIDPTYRQFFKEEDNKESNYLEIQNMIVKTPNPGFFIKNDDKDKIISFLKDGYSILDNDLARIYGDSFYNTKTGYIDKKFKTMNGEVYIRSFLKGNETLSKSKEELNDLGLLINENKKTR